MKIEKLILFLLLHLSTQFITGQDTLFFNSAYEITGNNYKTRIIIGVSGGYGKNFSQDPKEMNRDVLKTLTFDAQMTDNFPATLYYGGYLLFRIGDLYAGPDYQFHTTGSRLAYRDYSGSYTFDQILVSHSLAIRIQELHDIKKNFEFGISSLLGFHIASWKIDENLIIGEQNEASAATFNALRAFIFPSVKIRYRLTPSISLASSLGFSLDLFGKYHLPHIKKAKLDENAGWSGPRAELNLEYSF